jgi:AcrR family transcriptional regulator
MANDDKAQRILQAARTVLARKGYAATTINRVAQEAGVSRGLLHYYFKNKEDLLARVIEVNMQASVDIVQDLFARSSSAADFSRQLSSMLRNLLKSDPDFFNLFLEAWSVARQSPTLDQRFQVLYSRFRGAIGQGLEAAAIRWRQTALLSTQGTAFLITAIIDGLGLQLVTEPRLIEDEDLWAAVEKSIGQLLGEQSA